MIRNSSPILKIVLLLILLVMAFISLWQLYVSYQVQSDGMTKMAVIEAYREKLKNPQSINSKTIVYAPTFSFTLDNDRKITVASGNYLEQKKYSIGQQVRVYYPKDQPHKAMVEGYFPYKTYIILAIFGFIGAALFGYSLKLGPDSKS